MGWIEKLMGNKGEGEKSAKDTWVILILFGILLLIVFFPTGANKNSAKSTEGGLTDNNQSKIEETQAGRSLSASETDSYVHMLESRLEETLRCMEGVGQTKVMITLKSSKEAVVEKDVPMVRNNTTESDAQGGTRSITEYTSSESTVFDEHGTNGSSPYVIKTLEPEVEGVIVIAQGGGNEKICKNITEAIQALFGIEPHKIKVVKMKTTS